MGVTDAARRKAELVDLVESMEAVPFDHDAAAVYARLRAALEAKGNLIGPRDLLIAAQAVSRDLVLVTANLREFKRVPELRCENWMK